MFTYLNSRIPAHKTTTCEPFHVCVSYAIFQNHVITLIVIHVCLCISCSTFSYSLQRDFNHAGLGWGWEDDVIRTPQGRPTYPTTAHLAAA